MRTRNREIGIVLGAVLLATCLVALQLAAIGLALNEIGKGPAPQPRPALVRSQEARALLPLDLQ
jgi:hypothetical protein